MADNVKVCEANPELQELLKKFRFRKETNNAALILKIDIESETILLEEEMENCSIEELQETLPESQPRYIVLSYCYDHDDGRKSYPLLFIFLTPQGCKPKQQMMYAGSMKGLVEQAGFTKVLEIRSTEDLTEEWLRAKLKAY